MSLVIILANGTSSRFGSDKLRETMNNKSLLETTLDVFEHHPKVSEIILVKSNSTREEKENYRKKYIKIIDIVKGGNNRYESFVRGIKTIYKNSHTTKQKILVHNGANPFVTPHEISQVLENIKGNTAVGVGRKIPNTVRQWEENKSQTIPRNTLYAMETPQGAFLEDFQQWIQTEEKTRDAGKIREITDELMLAEKNKGEICILPASSQNIKITYPQDLPQDSTANNTQKFSITGFGIDSHPFEKIDPSKKTQKKCVLCGIEIPHSPAFLGNSDSDVALHALSNAILSGIGGNSFSNIADDMCKNGETNSEIYLHKILKKMREQDKNILHLVLSFEGKKPKIEKYFPAFRSNLSRILDISEKNIGLNASTGEDLDGVGKGDGMRVHAIVTMI